MICLQSKLKIINRKEDNMLLSIIIPFYNPMPYFDDLLKSLEKQDLSEVEIVFVNDGSTDNYDVILSSFLKKHSCAKIITTTNGGVSRAKNIGLKNSCGDYVWFVDADDMIDINAIENIVKRIKYYRMKADIIFSNFKGFNDQSVSVEYTSNYDYERYFTDVFDIHQNKDDIIDILFSKLKITYAIWYQIFQRAFLIKNNIFFDEKMPVSEDLDYKFSTLTQARYIGYLSQNIYIYRLPSSSRNSLSVKKRTADEIMIILNMDLKWYNYFKNNYEHESGKQLMLNRFAFFTYLHYNFIKSHSETPNTQKQISEKDDLINNILVSNSAYIKQAYNGLKKGNIVL